MKAIVRRLAKLEGSMAPLADQSVLRIAQEIRERRRKRMEAMGLPFEEAPPLPYEYTRPPIDIARVLRWARERKGGNQSDAGAHPSA